MAQDNNDTTPVSADVDRAFAQLELALSGDVQPDETTDEMTLVTAVELLVVGGALYFLNWALGQVTARLSRRDAGS
jgi:hypothetical protein